MRGAIGEKIADPDLGVGPRFEGRLHLHPHTHLLLKLTFSLLLSHGFDCTADLPMGSVVVRDLSKLDRPIQAWTLLARDCKLWVVASEGGLVELGALPAHKAVLVHPVQAALVVIDGDADVEYLAPVVHIGIVAVACILLIAVEAVIIGSV